MGPVVVCGGAGPAGVRQPDAISTSPTPTASRKGRFDDQVMFVSLSGLERDQRPVQRRYEYPATCQHRFRADLAGLERKNEERPRDRDQREPVRDAIRLRNIGAGAARSG